MTKSFCSNIEDLTEVFLVDDASVSSVNVNNNDETDRLLSDDKDIDLGEELDRSNTLFEDELSESTTPLN